jgi:hypothetical protein
LLAERGCARNLAKATVTVIRQHALGLVLLPFAPDLVTADVRRRDIARLVM